MSANFLNFEYILIGFLLLIPWPDPGVVKTTCSRDASRLVRKIVRSKWTPILDKYQVKLPLECPLHPFRDLYAPRQDAKKRDRPTQWTCRVCGKSFYQEKFLDQHFDKRHKDIINKAEDSVCLADLCDVLRCEVFRTEESSSLKTGDQNIITDVEVWGDSLGQNSAYRSLVKLRSTALSGARAKGYNHQLCPDQVSQIIFKENEDQKAASDKSKLTTKDSVTKKTAVGGGGDPNSANAHQHGSASSGQATTTSTTSTSSKPGTSQAASSFSQSAAGSSAKFSAKASTGSKQTPGKGSSPEDPINPCVHANDQDGESNASDDGGNKSANDSSIPKIRANCKPEELHRLKLKCEQLVRDCIGGTLLSMSDQSFKEMEVEMNKAVCWYLSCDRYWEDGPLEPRPPPFLLILVLLFCLSTGICFCYYIIWVLFDSEEVPTNSSQHSHSTFYNNAYQQHSQPHVLHPQHHPAYQQQYPQAPPPTQHYYYQQPQQQQQPPVTYTDQYDYHHHVGHRHSPRHHSVTTASDLRSSATGSRGPTSSLSSSAIASSVVGGGGAGGSGHVSKGGSQSTSATPLHHHRHQHHLQQQQQLQQQLQQQNAHHLAYQQDILDRRDYISRPIATTALGGQNSSAAAGATASSVDCDRSAGGGGGVGAVRHYNTHPRPLNTHHRYVGSSQQSLRGSSSSHEIIQNEVGQNEHYIYVTYPPDLKKRFFEKYE